MSVSIASQSYGKASVGLSYIARHDDHHDFIQIEASIALEGGFDDAYTQGDNRLVVPTDTMKNTVYGIARQHGVENIEQFAQQLANHFFDSFDHVDVATVSLVQHLWTRMDLDGNQHGHAFVGGRSEQNTCVAKSDSHGVSLHSGLRGLQVLKTTESGFSNFLQDKFTTLKPTDDRIFATTITADWPCKDVHHDWTATRKTVRALLLDVFAHQYSPSVQKTLHDMAASVLAACPEIDQISLNMPNQHHILADLEKLKLQNENDIFVPTPEPFGVISATIQRNG